MRIALYYGSTEGQTAKIAAFIEDRLRRRGHAVTSLDASQLHSDHRVPPAGLVIISASLHMGRYQASIEHLVRNNIDKLLRTRSAFVSVSLSAAGDRHDQDGIKRRTAEFLTNIGWRPAYIEYVAGAFRFSRYDFFKRMALKYIAYRKGQPTDTSQDRELTDWRGLGNFIDWLVPQSAEETGSKPRRGESP